MKETLDLIQAGTPEEIERKKERLTPIFEKSENVFYNQERELKEGTLELIRKLKDGKIEKISGLVVVEINKDGPNLCGIDENGEPTASATMLWNEIIDAKPENK